MMKRLSAVFIALILLIGILVQTGCGKKEQAADPLALSWDQIEEAAKGSQINFYMWGGDSRINGWVDDYVGSQIKERYGITLNRVPMNAEDFMNKLANEKQAGKKNGSIDLLWINGENFFAAKENGMLFGPFAEKLPNFNQYINKEAPENSLDFGYPTEGYEVPYGRAQLVLIYDSSRLPNPPRNLSELEAFIKENPGKFTYPAPPDFTGSAFIRNIMYMTTGGYEQYMTASKDQIADMLAPTWDYISSLKPYLWREGKTYPSNIGQLDNMFADGEVLMSMTYSPLKPSGDVLAGVFPKDTKTFVLEEGTISNTHFLAIPHNASNKAGAMVVANFLQGFEAQLSKLDPVNWGDLPVFDIDRLTQEQKDQINQIDLGKATASQEDLIKHRVPEIPAKLVPILEELWIKNVAKE